MIKNMMIALAVLASGVAAAGNLTVPQVSAQGHNCGGVKKSIGIVGFDTDNNVQATIIATTSCGGSGRGGGYHVTRYQSTYLITWSPDGSYEFGWSADLAMPGSIDSQGDTMAVFGNGTVRPTVVYTPVL